MNRYYLYKSVFLIVTVPLAGLVSWMTNWEFGVVWYVIALVTTDLMFVFKKVFRP